MTIRDSLNEDEHGRQGGERRSVRRDVGLLGCFKDLQAPRQPGKVSYPLDEVLLLCLLAVLAGAECFTEIALFGLTNPLILI